MMMQACRGCKNIELFSLLSDNGRDGASEELQPRGSAGEGHACVLEARLFRHQPSGSGTGHRCKQVRTLFGIPGQGRTFRRISSLLPCDSGKERAVDEAASGMEEHRNASQTRASQQGRAEGMLFC